MQYLFKMKSYKKNFIDTVNIHVSCINKELQKVGSGGVILNVSWRQQRQAVDGSVFGFVVRGSESQQSQVGAAGRASRGAPSRGDRARAARARTA